MDLKHTTKHPLLLRAAEVGPLAGLSTAMIYKQIASGALPSLRVGRSIRVPLQALERWIESNTQGGDTGK
jgi:excisionase family DNA binding protein